MPEMIVWRPFEIFELPDQVRPEPSTFLHLFFCQPLTPSTIPGFRQICERTFLDFQAPKTLHQRDPKRWREAGARTRRVNQALSFVIPEDNGVECRPPNRIAPNDKVLGSIDSHFLPCA